MCAIDSCDPADFYTATIRRARKTHQCFECRREINPGEEYEYVTGSWDRQITSFKTCAHCLAGRHWLSAWCGGFMHGNVLDETIEHFTEWEVERTVNFGRLVVWMRRKWCRADGSLIPSDEVAELARAAYESTKAATAA